ncbi:hypothetical protein SBOR_7833 [Sclerotinia borealis F-4128]|uniref:Uncharacterized protein n=1 Tax=Sclerotinia borealis (strain F-4128) TaxID=1432307 RepID=W9C4U0_SCLBF|nr:hypothetical protein SBOR_7833 [Sclerotinia borealis F-4128]
MMDKVKAIMEKGKEVIQRGKEQELFQSHDDYKNPDAAGEWKKFLKSAHYGAVVPAGYLDVDQRQNDPSFCIETFVHRFEVEARCAVLIKQFNAYKGNTEHNQLLVSDIIYYNLAHDTAETEVWRGILNFRPFDATYMDAVTQLPKLGLERGADISVTTWHPVFGPKYVRPVPREGSLMSFMGSDVEAQIRRAEAFYTEGTAARLTRAPTFGSSTASDREWVSNVLNGCLNVSDEWLVHSRPASIISGCSALINHHHECTAPADALPASPTFSCVAAPAATGRSYTGPNPSDALDQRLEDHVHTPITRMEIDLDLESASQKKSNLEYRFILAAVIVFFIGGSIAAIVTAIVVAIKRKTY